MFLTGSERERRNIETLVYFDLKKKQRSIIKAVSREENQRDNLCLVNMRYNRLTGWGIIIFTFEALPAQYFSLSFLLSVELLYERLITVFPSELVWSSSCNKADQLVHRSCSTTVSIND